MIKDLFKSITDKMKLQLLRDLNNHRSPSLISFNTDPVIGKKPYNTQDSFNVDIKTNPVNISREIVLLYIPIFKNRYDEVQPKILVLLNKILKGQNLTMEPHIYVMAKNLLVGGALQVFEHKSWA